MLINTRHFCEENIFGSMLEVARYHAQVKSLFRNAGNQGVAEIAGARYVAHVDGSWNCAKDPKGNLSGCHIVHGDAATIRKWCVAGSGRFVPTEHRTPG